MERLLKDALDKGGKVVTGGHRHALGGTFFEPTVIAGATPTWNSRARRSSAPWRRSSSSRPRKRPSASPMPTEYGLACYFFTKDLGAPSGGGRARIWAGGRQCRRPSHRGRPFGGVKESGFGKEGSKYGCDDYLVVKYVCLGGI